MRQKRKNKIIIFSLLGLLAIMAVGYAAFNTNLKIKGTSGISSNWNILITNVTKSNTLGGAEEVKAPTWTDLTAYMEANLYEKGDAIEYDVTVENRGTLDATLEKVSENIKSTNEAVKITFSGYTKGQILYKNSSQIIKVKIEYNPEFEGTPEEGSGEVSVDLNYTQADPGKPAPQDKYLVTYDCTTNGGQECTSYNEYLNEGASVNLNYTATKEGQLFIGWNTNKDLSEKIEELSMPNEDVTLYAIYKEESQPTLEVSTSKTTNSITVVADAYAESGIEKYEYSINGGEWILSKNNTHTFTGLTKKTEYNIRVRITSKLDKVETKELKVTTNDLVLPTFSENTAKTTVTITYPAGCGSKYTCTYKYNDGSEVTVNDTATTITKTAAGNIVAKVTDGTNTVSSSYTVLHNALYVSNAGNDSTGYGTTAKPYATLSKAYSMATPTATIYAMNTITQNTPFSLNQNKNITLTSYSTNNTINIIKKGKALSEFLIVASNGTLTLTKITLDGNSVSDIKGGIWVGGGTLNLNSGSTITKFVGNKNTGYFCGTGLRIESGATLNINGGTISYNTGICSTAIHSGGTIVFNSGSINNNKSTDGNSSGITNYGTLTMNNGTISNNESVANAGGVENNGTFTMKAGTISGNTVKNSNKMGGGIYSSSGSILNISGGTISGNTAGIGGGIYFTGKTMNLTGGTIKNNIANVNGGGVEMYNGTITLDGVTVDNNTATNVGGGLHAGSGTTTIKKATITNNKSTNSSGAGIRGTGTAVININNVTISSNTAGTSGGGIEVYSNSKVTMYGGVINGNKSGDGGAGVLVSGGSGHTATFTLSGGSIKNNTATKQNGGIYKSGNGTYTYKSGTVCGNRPTNSYERATNC